MRLLILLMLNCPMVAVAGCCGDIPESFIWSLSMFLLVGFAVVAIVYTAYPQPFDQVCPQQSPTVTIRIDPTDLCTIVEAIRNHPLKNQ